MTTITHLSFKLLTVLRLLFLTLLSTDFLLTVFSASSQKALVLAGLGSSFSPFIVLIWLILIFGFCIITVNTWSHVGPQESKFMIPAVILLHITILMYVTLMALAVVNPLIAWPLIIQYGLMVVWSGILLYFRRIAIID